MKLFRLVGLAAALAIASPAGAQYQVPDHSVPVGRGGASTGFKSAVPGVARLPLVSNGPAADPSFQALNVGIPSLTTPVQLASAVDIPVNSNIVYVVNVSGASPPTAGYGTCGLTYRKSAVSTGLYGEVLNASSGTYWQPQYSNSPVRTCEFGAIGDGTYNFTTGAVAGTDNTAIIQAALDYAMQQRLNTVCISDGRYKTTDTLQVGWGQAFYSLSLVSCNGSRSAFFDLAGVQILPIKTDRCALNIQGGRSSLIKGLSFIGQNYVFASTLISAPPFPAVNTGWLAPALATNPGGLQQHSPYAAICIDAYSGSIPADPYPTVTYPAWTGIVTQYGKAFSSDMEISNVEIIGFALAVNLQPSGDGNGDFLKVLNLNCEYTTYCVSVAQTQSRNNAIQNLNCNGVYAAITNIKFGVQQGQLDGPMDNIACGNGYQMFEIGNLNGTGDAIFSHLYTEAMVKIATIGGGGSYQASVRFKGCHMSMFPTVTGYLADAMVTSGGTNISFEDCNIDAGDRISTLVNGQAVTVTISNGVLRAGERLGALFNAASVQRALNYSGGILVGATATWPLATNMGRTTWLGAPWGSYMPATNSDAGSSQALIGYPQTAPNGGVRLQYNQATIGFVDQFISKKWDFAAAPMGMLLSLSSVPDGDVSVVAAYTGCDTVTFTLTAARQTNQPSNLTPGDVFYHLLTGTNFVVTAVGAPDGSGNYPITLRQMNNMTVNTSTGVCTANKNTNTTLTGYSFIYHTGVVAIPGVVFFGDFTSGSVNVVNISRGDGFAGNLTTYIAANDTTWPYVPQDAYFKYPFPGLSHIVTVTNGSPGSATLSANATVTGRFPILPLPIAGGPQ